MISPVKMPLAIQRGMSAAMSGGSCASSGLQNCALAL